MKAHLFLKLMFTVFCVLALGACAFFKPTARTVNEAAKIACEAMFAQEAEQQGFSLEEACATREVLDPIIRQLLAAQAARAGLPAREPVQP